MLYTTLPQLSTLMRLCCSFNTLGGAVAMNDVIDGMPLHWSFLKAVHLIQTVEYLLHLYETPRVSIDRAGIETEFCAHIRANTCMQPLIEILSLQEKLCSKRNILLSSFTRVTAGGKE